MKYILTTTIAIFFSILASGQIWYTPVDTIVPGISDTTIRRQTKFSAHAVGAGWVVVEGNDRGVCEVI